MGEIAQSIDETAHGNARDLRLRLARYARIVEAWTRVDPSEEQLTAMAEIVAEMREEVGLPPGLTSGFVARQRGE